MRVLVRALLVFVAALAAAQATSNSSDDVTHTTCAPNVNTSSDFSWWNNHRDENPCEVLQALLRKCDPGHNIHLMPSSPLERPDICQKTASNDDNDPDDDGSGDGGEDDPNKFIPCCCNTAAYALREACWSCQRGQLEPSGDNRRPTFREYLQCPKTVEKPHELYQNVSVPHWAFIPVDPDNAWNFTYTRNLFASPVFNDIIKMDIASNLADDPSNSTDGSSDNSTSSAQDNNGHHGGGGNSDNSGHNSTSQLIAAVLGGGLSGLALVVVMLLVVLYIRRRRRTTRRAALEDWARQHEWQEAPEMDELALPSASLARGRYGREPLIPRAQATYDVEETIFEEPTRRIKLSDPRLSESFQWADQNSLRASQRRSRIVSAAETNFSL